MCNPKYLYINMNDIIGTVINIIHLIILDCFNFLIFSLGVLVRTIKNTIIQKKVVAYIKIRDSSIKANKVNIGIYDIKKNIQSIILDIFLGDFGIKMKIIKSKKYDSINFMSLNLKTNLEYDQIGEIIK